MNELESILDGLIRRTSDGKLRWSRAAEANQFVTAVDTIAVIVRRRDVHSSLRDDAVAAFELEILDEKGTLIETFGSRGRPATSEQRGKLSRLHDLARYSALNVQQTLEKLAKALEA